MARLHRVILTVEWNLGNECNLKCSYCHKELHEGVNLFPPVDQFCPAFDHLIEQARAFSRINVEFSGGEPTQSPSIQHIILSNVDDRIKFKLHSNAQAPVAWWQDISHKLYDLTLSYHHTTSFNEFLSVVTSVSRYLRPRINIAVTPETWTEQLQSFNLLQDSGHDVHLQILYSNFTRGNNQYLKYTDDQWSEYYHLQGIDINDPQQVMSTIEFKRINHLNNYYGHLCWAGHNQIVIDNFGDVYRGWCKSNNSLGNIFRQDIVLDKQPAPCPKTQCKNGFDLQARKSKGTWGIA